MTEKFYGAELNFSENPKLLWNKILQKTFDSGVNYVEFVCESNAFDTGITREISDHIKTLYDPSSVESFSRKLFRWSDMRVYIRLPLTSDLKKMFLSEDIDLVTWSMVDYIDPCFYRDDVLLLSTHARENAIDLSISICDDILYQELCDCELIEWDSVEDTQPTTISSRWGK